MPTPTKNRRSLWRRSPALVALVLAAVVLALRGRSELGRVYAGLDRPMPDPAPVLTPARALTTLETADRLNVSLAAAEPMVEAPIAGQFDEDGRLWLVEMPTYMRDLAATGEKAPGGRVVILEDLNGDGAFDKRTVFLDGLVLARAVAPCYGGALVLEPPNLYFCRDTDGDGVCDVKRVVLTGVGIGENPEHEGNGLIRGIDNWYHLSQDRLEFRFDGRTVQTRSTPAHGQWGIGQDDFGRLYYTPNSNPLLTDLYPKHYAARNPAQGGAPGIGEDIGKDGTTWPSHPTTGVNRGYQENVLRTDGTLASVTAACGTLVYRAAGLGEQFRGNVFICEAAGNLVKRLVLRERGGLPRAENAYKGTEFLRSTDERFRPVNLVTGPDGALYVIDMYRGLIQHRTYVTPFLAKQVRERGLETPLILGRVYRVSGDPATLRHARTLSAATVDELVELLSDPDGWWRDTAQRLLAERHDQSVALAVRQIVLDRPSAAARVQALWTLEAVGCLTWQDAATGLKDPDAAVRANCARLLEGFVDDANVGALLLGLIDDPDRDVRVQAAASLGSAAGAFGEAALTATLRKFGGDRYVRGAVMGGAAGREAPLLRSLLLESGWPRTDADRAVQNDLTDLALRDSGDSRTDLVELVGRMAANQDRRAEPLLARIRRAQRIDSDDPRPLKLSREPSAWLAAAAMEGEWSKALGESTDYFDWPGRPPVARKAKVRELTAAEQKQFALGQQLYSACIGCHQPDGSGSVGMAPPLAGSAIAQGPSDRLAKVLLHGMEGPYTMLEMEFSGVMVPAPVTTDAEVAALMTFVRRSFGNQADPVDAALVAQVRAANATRNKPWMRSEIEEKK